MRSTWGVLVLAVFSWCCDPKPKPEAKHAKVEAGAPVLKAATVPAAGIPPYNRREWRHWIHAGKNCRDTRQEAIIKASEVPVTYADAKQCHVATGRWYDPYSGEYLTNASQLQVDHVVALEEAHLAGGWQWTPEQKQAYANDLASPHHLEVVSVHSNESKGSHGPTEWLPPNVAYRCEYLKRRVAILQNYKLEYNRESYSSLLSQYCK